jgi:hypothetical protein
VKERKDCSNPKNPARDLKKRPLVGNKPKQKTKKKEKSSTMRKIDKTESDKK